MTIVEAGDILVISPFNGLIDFSTGERFGSIFEIDQSNGGVTKILEFGSISNIPSFPEDGRTSFENGLKFDPSSNLYVLDQSFPLNGGHFGFGNELGAVLQVNLANNDAVALSDFNDDSLGPSSQCGSFGRPLAMDTDSSGNIYTVGCARLVKIDPTDCKDPFPEPNQCSRTLVSNWYDSSQGPTLDIFNEDNDGAIIDIAIDPATDNIYALEECQGDCFGTRVWKVDPTNGNREIIDNFSQGGFIPISIEVDNSGMVLVSQGFVIHKIDPVSGGRSILSDFVNPAQGDLFFGGPGKMEVNRFTGDIFVSSASIVRVDPVSGSRNLVSDLIFTFAPGDTFRIGVHDIAIAPGDVTVFLPGVPVLSAISIPPGKAELSWTIPDDGGCAIREYVIEAGLDPFPEDIIRVPGGTTTTSDTPQGLGTFRIAAVNCVGQGPFSDFISIVLCVDPDGDFFGSPGSDLQECQASTTVPDNCPDDSNPLQTDSDSDGVGDVCDNCPNNSNSNQEDNDNDEVGNVCDNCIDDSNPTQFDFDGDSFGDACDVCPQTPINEDNDNDGFCGIDQFGITVDCNDFDPNTNPDAPEICSDGIDQNCNGSDLSCLALHSPVIRQTDGQDTSNDYDPKTINSMLKESDLKGPLRWECDKRVCAFGKCLCIFGHPTFKYENKPVSVSELLDHDSSDFDLDMRSASPGYFPIDSGIPSPSRFDKYQTTVYGREALFSNNFDFSGLGLDLKAGTHIVLQYWMLYPYNNWENNHEGDWEMLQVILDSSTKDPEFITYSWHNGGTTYSWSDSRVQKYLGTHPVAYVSSGSHATYWSAGTHHSYQDVFGFGGNLCTKLVDFTSPVKITHGPPGADSSSLNAFFGSPNDNYKLKSISSSTPWIQWNGHWGEVTFFGKEPGIQGPPGPLFSKTRFSKWNEPLFFAALPLASIHSVCMGSPGILNIFDSEGNHVGLNDEGKLEANIPGLYMYNEEGDLAIIETEGDLMFKIVGTEVDELDFAYGRVDNEASTKTTVVYNDISFTEDTIAIVNADDSNPDFVMEIDIDGDGIMDMSKMPDVMNVEQLPVLDPALIVTEIPLPPEMDGDGDGIVDSLDNCPNDTNAGQEDFNDNGTGDACEDSDADGHFDAVDNCPTTPNNQEDSDNDKVGDACDVQTCGNGNIESALGDGFEFIEQCDDGNVLEGDGCTSFCEIEIELSQCGNTFVDAEEECDDGNNEGGDGCSFMCTIEQCGNGITDIGEQCDDGNIMEDDGCSSQCTLQQFDEPDFFPIVFAVGGELVSIDFNVLMLAGTHSTAAWLIPVIVSGIGFAIVIARKF